MRIVLWGRAPMHPLEQVWLSRALLRSILDASPDCIGVIAPDGSLQYVNANGLRALEIDDFSAVRDREWASLWPSEGAAAVRDAVARALAGSSSRFEAFCPTAKGGPRWWDVCVAPMRDEAGAVTAVVSISRDVTGGRAAEAASRESEARFRTLADQTPVMMWVTEPDETCTFLSRRWREFTGLAPEEACGPGWINAVHPDDRAMVRQALDGLYGTRGATQLEYRLRRADGAYRWVIDSALPRLDADGACVGFMGTVVDITERREREEETHRYRALVEQSSDFIGFATLDRKAVFVNEGARRLVGAPDDVDLSRLEILDFFLPEDRAVVAESMIPRQLAGEPWVGEFRFRHFRTGEPIPVWYNAFPIKDAAGKVTALATVTRNIAAQKQAEAALRASEEHLRVAQTAGGVATWEWILDSGEVIWSEAMNTLLGLPENHPPSYAAFAQRIHPDDKERLRQSVDAALAGSVYNVEFRIVRPDGELRWVAGRAEVGRDAEGTPTRMIGVNFDVTERRVAVDALAALNADLERRVAETASRLAQLEKMESIGRLTGGIAHDFNNLLSVVLCNLEVLQARVGRSPHLLPLVESAMRGAERGASLVERLLAFARKQELHPAPVDVGALVDDMREMLARSLGPRISIRTSAGADVPPALVDANQLEAALLNLAVNARDAMPNGGTLRIEVDTLQPSTPNPDGARFVRIRVSDEGVGMDEATLRRATEPFYTTKGVGRGTGLGLSMVHGMAIQSGGDLVLASAPGRGTSVEIHLPVAAGTGVSRSEPASERREPSQKGLTLLLVDDEEGVREGTAALLQAWGHTVVATGSGDEALLALRLGGVDALITDHTMPGMTGLELALAARKACPDLPIVIVSGHLDLLGEHEGLDVHTAPKPLRGAALNEILTSVAGIRQAAGRPPDQPDELLRRA